MSTPKKKGATKHCAYGTCSSDSRYPDRPDMQGVFFIRFPQNNKYPEKCMKWSKACTCSRQNFTEKDVKKDTYICSLHFVGGKGPSEDYPDPIPATATKYDVARLTKKPRVPARRRLALTPVTPKLQDDVKLTTEKDEIANILLSLHNSIPETIDDDVEDKENIQDSNSESIKRPCYHDIRNISQSDKPAIMYADSETQTSSSLTLNVKESLKLKIENYELKRKLADITTTNTTGFSLETVQKDDKQMHFYTGLTFPQFLCLWNFLGNAVDCLSRLSQPRKSEDASSVSGPRRKLSPKNELFLTLVRLRLGLLYQDLAYRFNISVSTVNEIVTTWIQFIFLQFNRLRPQMFASRKKTQKHLPRSFKRYKDVRVILDATEFFTQAPRNYKQQGNMYSSYKNHCTCKVLIGITPSGSISFVSDVYEGSISDKELLKKSGILDKLHSGDRVMVDRGFNVRDLLLEKGADIVIPPFLGGRKNLTPQEECQTRTIAKLRIHVERAIERLKKFKILKKIVPINSLSTFSQTVFIVGCLVNFQKPIVK